MIDILTEILGEVPSGYEFLLHIYGFILVLAGLLMVYKAVCAFLDIFR